MNHTASHKPGVLRATLTAIAIFVVFTIGGHFSNRYIPHAVLVPLLKYAIGIVGAVWVVSLNVYNKLFDVTDMSGLDFRQHRNIEIEISTRLHWFWLRTIFLGILALTMYAPTILDEARVTISGSDWVIGAACGALALALFSLRRLWSELEEIRGLRSYVKEIERREEERINQINSIKDGHEDGWKADPHLDGFRTIDQEKKNTL
jgi:hypothetical protein